MAYELKKLTDRELEVMDQLNEALWRTTSEEMERIWQEINAFSENNKEFFAKLDEWSKSEDWGLLRLPDKE